MRQISSDSGLLPEARVVRNTRERRSNPGGSVFQLNRIAASLLLASTLFFANVPVMAQKKGEKPNPDEPVIHDYILKMDRVQLYATAVKEIEAGAKDPAVEAEGKKVQDYNGYNVEKAKMIETSCPHLNAWIVAHGMTAQEFVILPMTLITAGMASYAVDKGGKAPAFVNPANVQFVKDHKDELEKMGISGDSGSSE
jgi:hypothetical protein